MSIIMLYSKFALIINSDAPAGIVTDPVPVTEVLPMRFQINLLFTKYTKSYINYQVNI